MKRKLTHNAGLKLISILIACTIWLIVSNNNDPEMTRTIKGVPITFRNQETLTQANKTYTVNDDIDKVVVYVTGRKSVVNKLNSSSFTVKADMENYNEDIKSVPLEISCTDSRIAQQDLRVTPPSLKIQMEEKQEDTFGIAVSLIGKTEKGYEIGTTRIVSGDTIRIAGPASLISIIGKVVVAVDINEMSDDSEEMYPITIEDKNGAAFTDSQMKKLEIKDTNGVTLTDNMATVSIDVWKLYADIPLQLNIVGQPADNYRVAKISFAPKTVNLVGQEEAVESLGGNLVLEDVVSVEGLSKTQEITLNINNTLENYENIRSAEDTATTVIATIEIAEVGSRALELPISMIKPKNVPKEKKLIFSPADYITVNIKTTEADLGELTAEMVEATIDLKNCQINGNYTIPVSITLPEGYELVDEVSLVVNIEDTDKEAEGEANPED